MAKSLVSKRIIFKNKGEQQKFIIDCKNKLDLKWKDVAGFLNINQRTLSDWKKEKFNMSYDSAIKLSKKTNIKIPKNTKIQIWEDHLKKISKKGGDANYKKYGKVGDGEKREKAWIEWWNTKGKFQDNEILKPKSIKEPKYNDDLAEFIGIMMGDGGMSDYCIKITLNSDKDKEYSSYICSLINKIFEIKPRIYFVKNKKAINIVIYRKNMVSFCQSVGLKKGNKLKEKFDIPNWINEKSKYQKSCLRGLVDTDGCFYMHSYKSKGKRYSYLKIDFTSASPVLLSSVLKILKTFGINGKINYNVRSIRIENQADVKKYIQIIGSNNPRNKVFWRGG